MAAMVLANWAASPISRAMPCLIAEQSFGCGTATLLKGRSQGSASPRQTGHGASTYSEQKLYPDQLGMARPCTLDSSKSRMPRIEAIRSGHERT